ncbi:MAG: AarF/ABC1/UbiB kinase family protein [Acidobacteriia bacterium]|nr:AarF/ABC1/UbiB kinase family protein [Terriglobia bacterium]
MQRKLKRAAELGGLARTMASLQRGSSASARQSQTSVVQRLAQLHGLPQKIGQILSLGELGGEERLFSSLTETAPALSSREAFEEIEKALGRPLGECFAHIEAQGVGASLAQVHKAILPDGRAVAVKIQYPGIADALDLDLRALGWLTAPVGGLNRGFDLSGYRREIGSMFREELNYRHEAEMLGSFREVARRSPRVEIPEVVEEFSNERVLTMAWLDGEPFASTHAWPLAARTEAASVLLRFFLASCFSWGLLHADPHAGNYRFRLIQGRPVIGLLDFGCVKALDARATGALSALIEDTATGVFDPIRARSHFEAMGFQALLLAPMQHLLPGLSEILFEPFSREQPFDLNAWRLGERVEAHLGEFRWNFRMAGPPQLIFFMRAYQGLIQYLKALDAPVNWQEEYRRLAAPALLPEPGAKAAAQSAWPVRAKSSSLKIRVAQSGRTKAEVTFLATVAENLPELMPLGLEEKLANHGIDVAQIAQKAVAGGFAPGDLFHFEEGAKSYRVWLE